MKQVKNSPLIIDSISEMHRWMSLPGPEHPLVSAINFRDILYSGATFRDGLVVNFYIIALKKEYKGKYVTGSAVTTLTKV